MKNNFFTLKRVFYFNIFISFQAQSYFMNISKAKITLFHRFQTSNRLLLVLPLNLRDVSFTDTKGIDLPTKANKNCLSSIHQIVPKPSLIQRYSFILLVRYIRYSFLKKQQACVVVNWKIICTRAIATITTFIGMKYCIRTFW